MFNNGKKKPTAARIIDFDEPRIDLGSASAAGRPSIRPKIPAADIDQSLEADPKTYMNGALYYGPVKSTDKCDCGGIAPELRYIAPALGKRGRQGQLCGYCYKRRCEKKRTFQELHVDPVEEKKRARTQKIAAIGDALQVAIDTLQECIVEISKLDD